MKKILLTFFAICFGCAFVSAQDVSEEQTVEVESVEETVENPKTFSNHIIPVLGCQALQVEEKDFVLSPSLNFQYMMLKNKGVEKKVPDAIVIAGGYSMNYFTNGLGENNVKYLHGASLMGNVISGKNTFTAMVSSSGESPFSCIEVFTGGLMYSRNLISTEHVSFTLGGGVIVSDLGIKIQGYEIYAIPLPVFSFTYKNNIFEAGISMQGMPAASLTILPKSMVRFKGSCGMAGFNSIRDLTFDCALVYYPLFNTKSKEFLSLSAGVSNKVSSFTLKDKSKYGYQYYSVYGEINAQVASLRCGYNFNGKTRFDGKETGDMYKGIFASLQLMYMF